MEKERRIKILSVVALIIAVLGLTIAFAALSTTLTINGSANVDSATWNVHFGYMAGQELGTAEVLDADIDDDRTQISFDVNLKQPGDAVFWFGTDLETYGTHLIQNDGTISAKLESIEKSPLCTLQSSIENCDWDNDGVVTQNDINKVNENIDFEIYVIDEENFYKLEPGLILKPNKFINGAVVFSYGKLNLETEKVEVNNVPSRNLSFQNVAIKLNFVQAD